MARINLVEIVDRMELELRPVLKQAILTVQEDRDIDEKALYREFRKEMNRRLSGWQRVPDSCVKSEY